MSEQTASRPSGDEPTKTAPPPSPDPPSTQFHHVGAGPAPAGDTGDAAFGARLLDFGAADPTGDPPGPAPAGAPVVPVGYDIERELSRGGMGVVYLARQVHLRRTVALKMLLAGGQASALDRVRFLAEAEAAAAIDDPRVVKVYDFGQAGGLPYLAMEYLTGGTLTAALARGALPPRRAADVVAKVARGVAAAHALGIVHRDLKPGNVLLDDRGEPKVADFGLAKRAAGSDLTQTQAVMGTPSYMAPEQARGDSKFAGPAADVWALGAVLYECLTGRVPFRGDTPLAVLHAVVSAAPEPPRRVDERVPRDLELVCLKCLAKDPRDRYPSAAELADDLDTYLAGRPVGVRAAGAAERAWRWCRRNPAVASLVAVAAGLLVAVAVVAAAASVRERGLRDRADAARDAAEAALAEQQRLTGLAGDRLLALRREAVNLSFTQGLSLCENGDAARGLLWLARGHEQAGAADLADLRGTGRTLLDGWARDVHRLRLAVPLEGAYRVVASADGAVIVTGGTGTGEVRRWDAATGEPLGAPVAHGGTVLALAVSPDGTRIFSGGPGPGRLWDAATGKPLPVAIEHGSGVVSAAFSPDGRRLVTCGGSSNPTTKLWDLGTGAVVGEPFRHGGYAYVAFSPDGGTFVTVSLDRHIRFWDGETGAQLGPPRTFFGMPGAAAFGSRGTRFAVGTSRGEVTIWDAQTRDVVAPVLKHEAHVSSLAFSPDGTHVLTGAQDGTARLWDATTGHPVGAPLSHRGSVTAVGFLPDGALVTGGPDSPVRVWARAGQRRSVELSAPGALALGADLSPDGRFVVAGWNNGTVTVCEAATGRPAAPVIDLPAPAAAVAFSPDGLWVALRSRDKKVYVLSARTWSLTGAPLDGEADLVRCAPAGGVLLTAGPGGGRLWDVVTGRAFGRPLEVPGGIRSAAFSPCGTRLVTGGRDGTARVWDVATGAPVGEPLAHPTTVTVTAFSANGELLATGGSRDVKLWDAATGRQRGPALPQFGFVGSLSFSPDGRTLLVGCDGGTAQLWAVASAEPVGPQLRHGGSVTAALFTFDGRLALTGSKDGTIRSWDAQSGRPAGPVLRQVGQIKFLRLRPSGHLLALSDNVPSFRVWDPSDSHPTATAWSPTVAEALTGIRLDATGAVHLLSPPDLAARRAAAAALLVPEPADAGRADVRTAPREPAPGPPGRRVLHGHAVQQVHALAGGGFVTCSHDGTFGVWPADGPPRRVRVGDGRDPVLALAAPGPTGTRVVVGTASGTVAVLPLDGATPLAVLGRHDKAANAVAVSPDGAAAVSGGWDGTVRRWDLRTGKPIGVTKAHGDGVLGVAYRPDGKQFATVGSDAALLLWDAATGEKRTIDGAHPRGADGVAYAPDGGVLATGGIDGVVRLWNPTSGKKLAELTGHTAPVIGLAFGPDGRLASGSHDGTVRLWDVGARASLGVLGEHRGFVRGVAFRSDGRAVASASWDRTVGVWVLPGAAVASPPRPVVRAP